MLSQLNSPKIILIGFHKLVACRQVTGISSQSVTNREGGRFILSGIGSSGGTCFLAVFIFRH